MKGRGAVRLLLGAHMRRNHYHPGDRRETTCPELERCGCTKLGREQDGLGFEMGGTIFWDARGRVPVNSPS